MQDTEVLQQLAEDVGTAQKLLELMDAEYLALAERNLVGLETLLTQKQSLLALLEQHGALRSQTLANAQLSIDQNGLAAFAAASAVGPDILEQARQLDEALDACRVANERNGQQIRNNQNTVSGMLTVLQGSNQATDLYDRRGSAAKSSYNRPLSQA